MQAKQSWDPEPRSFWTPAPSFWVGQERTLGVSFPLAWGIRVPLLSEAGTEVGDMLWSGAPCCSSDWREPQPGVRTAAPRLLGPSGAAGAWESVPCAPRPPKSGAPSPGAGLQTLNLESGRPGHGPSWLRLAGCSPHGLGSPVCKVGSSHRWVGQLSGGRPVGGGAQQCQPAPFPRARPR